MHTIHPYLLRRRTIKHAVGGCGGTEPIVGGCHISPGVVLSGGAPFLPGSHGNRWGPDLGSNLRFRQAVLRDEIGLFKSFVLIQPLTFFGDSDWQASRTLPLGHDLLTIST